MEWNHEPANAHAAPPQEVSRLVFASRANVRTGVYDEMERIRASALRHNPPLGVNTALLYQSGWFVQWKEGAADAVRKTMERVASDPRHSQVQLVHQSRGPRLLERPWSMAIVQCADPPAAMAVRVLEARRRLEDGGEALPTTVWRRLSTPMRHPGARQQADPDAFQRVLVCSSAGNASFELVRWLAQGHGQEVVPRRFAGAKDLDVGTDYVDFRDGSRVLRVIAMARNGLMLPLTRAFMHDYSHVILLLHGQREQDTWLVQRVVQACSHLQAPPSLLGVASSAGAQGRPSRLALRCGLAYAEALANPDSAPATWAAVSPQLALWREAAAGAPPA